MSMPPTFQRRFLSLWLPFLSTDRVRRQKALQSSLQTGATPPDPDTPLVLVSKTEGTQRIMASDRAAQGCGLMVGMAMAQARAMRPGVSVSPHDATADARLLEVIADWADRYTPLVGRHPPDGLVLDITGAAHLLGGEAPLRADLLDRLARQGLQATAAIAPTVGAAWALSRWAGQQQGECAILPTDITRAGLDTTLARLPVEALRLQPETTAALRRVGLKCIGDLIGRPRPALAARLGASLVLRLDQARGIDTEAISPRQPVPPAVVEHVFAEPILTTAAVAQTCQLLSDRLAALLDGRGQGATALELSVYRVDGHVKRIALRLASPCRHGKVMADLLGLRLGHLDDPLDPGFGYDLIRLAATAVASRTAEARELAGLELDSRAAPIQLAEACAALIDRLSARFGERHIQVLASADSHIPERAGWLAPATAMTSRNVQPMAAGALGRVFRPLRLFDPPECVEVVAEVPDGPPVHLRWRRRPVRILAAHGPERIAPEWWRPAALASGHAHDEDTRDYWRIEDATGRRLWLYREGFYGDGYPSPTPHPVINSISNSARRLPRWYVHGLFA